MEERIRAALTDLMGRWLSLPLAAHQRMAAVDSGIRDCLDALFAEVDQADPDWYTRWCQLSGHDPTKGCIAVRPTDDKPFIAAMHSPTLGHRWRQGQRALEIIRRRANDQPGDGTTPPPIA